MGIKKIVVLSLLIIGMFLVVNKVFAEVTVKEEETIIHIFEQINKPFSSIAGFSFIDKTLAPESKKTYFWGIKYTALAKSVSLDLPDNKYNRDINTSYLAYSSIVIGTHPSDNIVLLFELPTWINPVTVGVDLRYKIFDALIVHGGVGIHSLSEKFDLKPNTGFLEEEFSPGDTRIGFTSKNYTIGFFNYFIEPAELLKNLGVYWGVDLDWNKFSGDYDYSTKTGTMDKSWINRQFYPRAIVGLNWGILNYTLNMANGYTSQSLGLNIYFK